MLIEYANKDSMSNQRYPLDWPQGYKRTTSRLVRPLFKNETFFSSIIKVKDEVRKLCGVHQSDQVNLIISTNIPIRADGEPYSDYARRNIQDPGVAVYFKYNKEDVVLCCDKFVRIEDNLKAIAITIEDMRRIERNGVSDFIKRSFTGFKALPPGGRKWFEVLGYDVPPLSFAPVRSTYKDLVKLHHPDTNGGETTKFQEIQHAYDQAKKYYEL